MDHLAEDTWIIALTCKNSWLVVRVVAVILAAAPHPDALVLSELIDSQQNLHV